MQTIEQLSKTLDDLRTKRATIELRIANNQKLLQEKSGDLKAAGIDIEELDAEILSMKLSIEAESTRIENEANEVSKFLDEVLEAVR